MVEELNDALDHLETAVVTIYSVLFIKSLDHLVDCGLKRCAVSLIAIPSRDHARDVILVDRGELLPLAISRTVLTWNMVVCLTPWSSQASQKSISRCPL